MDMPVFLARALTLMLSTSMAALRASELHFMCNRTATTCAASEPVDMDPCAALNPLVTLGHVQFPILVCLVVTAFVHTPTLLLASHRKLLHVQAALARVLVLLCFTVGSRRASDLVVAPAIAYALALHGCTALLLVAPIYPPIVGRGPDQLARYAGAVCIYLYAWYVGPPLTVVDTPCLSGHCALKAHMLGLFFGDAVARLSCRTWRTHDFMAAAD